ncbi:2552_t:CDS:1, partial [Racocetra persica]
YISDKKAKLNATIQLERENILSKNIDLNNILKLPDRHNYNIDDIKDSIKYQGKSKPASNHIKAYNKNKKVISSIFKKENTYKNLENMVKNNNTSRHKYRLYNKTEYYTSKYLIKKVKCI